MSVLMVNSTFTLFLWLYWQNYWKKQKFIYYKSYWRGFYFI